MDVSKVYAYALQREREGFDFFEQSAGRLQHAAAAGMFRRLADEEKRHIDYIQSLIAGQGGSAAAESAGLQGEGFFAQRAEQEMLEQTLIESMVPDLSVLRMAYLVERDIAEFYESAAATAEGPARDALKMLADWERGHERFFKELHDRVYAEYMQMPWGG